MTSCNARTRATVVSLGLLFGLLFAAHLYGIRILDPSSVDWLMGESDPLTHFASWDFFRRDAWRFPLGANPHYGTLVDSSIVYSDATPLFAFALKPFATWLPDPLQYQGLLLGFNFALNGAVAAAVALSATGHPPSAVLFSALAVTLPLVTLRGMGAHGHESLTALWVLWLGVWLLLVPADREARWRRFTDWTLLLVLAATLHFYLLFMVGVFWVVERSVVVLAHGREARSLVPCLRPLVESSATLAILVVSMGITGYFGPLGGAGDRGYGYFSAEVWTFLNPAGSGWFQARPGLESLSDFVGGWRSPIGGQYEGQAYLGLGALSFLGIAASAALVRFRKRGPPGAMRFRTAAFAAGVLFVIALGNRWVFGTTVIDVPYPRALVDALAVVRSSGRLCWPLACVLLLVALVALVRAGGGRTAVVVLAACVVLQFLDLAGWHRAVRGWARRDVARWALLDDPRVTEWVKGRRAVTLLPPTALAHVGPLAWIAARQGMTVNTAYYARMSVDRILEAAKNDTEKVRAGELRDTELYVLAEEGLIEDACAHAGVRCEEVGPGVVVAVRRARP